MVQFSILSESDQSYIRKRPDSGTLSTIQKDFFEALKDFTLMRLGFDAGDEKKLCRCPCGRQSAKWRSQNGLEDLIRSEEAGCFHSQFCTPSGLKVIKKYNPYGSCCLTKFKASVKSLGVKVSPVWLASFGDFVVETK
jgi:hypothetical protein